MEPVLRASMAAGNRINDSLGHFVATLQPRVSHPLEQHDMNNEGY
jgi:hypothetical protein